jgi:hypothetical protein
MANTYTWVIEAMDCVPQEDGETDVVITVHWRQNATDGTYNATVYGTVGLTYDPDSPFTQYADLTQNQVIGWVQGALGFDQCAQLAANLDQQIANQVNPPVVTPPLPWVA